MAPFVHHPDAKHTGTDRVGARRVEWKDGVAEVGVPSLLGRYQRAGYAVTQSKRRPKAAEETVVTEEPGAQLDD